MQRRRVLLAGGAVATATAAAALAWPAWLRRAFASGHATLASHDIEPEPNPTEPCPGAMRKPLDTSEPRQEDTFGQTEVEQAIQRAQAERKRVLVLVIPNDPRDTSLPYHRGRAFGEYLNHGGDQALAPLATAVVVCASVEAVNAVLKTSVKGAPLMLVIDPQRGPGEIRELSAELPASEPGYYPTTGKAEPPEISKRIQLLTALVAQGLGAAPAGEAAAMAAKVRDEIVKKRPTGGQWARSSGCGVDYEEGPLKNHGGVDCGMGHVPERSQRFLNFLVKPASKP